ncbi:aminotransferase class III-fold pyridoxal phosphate-dependent enzyme [Micromonospora sp. NPDC049171]|uniref:aminotransferase class III-fold pyridoxal phosphate-dependent enzyme n=1 Tax=Micromonospora sp. NPDC049171 TaxID=3155770 RepID=UPI0033F3B485
MTTTESHAPELAEPQMLGFLAQLGIDVEFIRAEGDTLFYRNDAGEDVPVLDVAGGYGALILGHNHPEIVDAARDFFAAGRPVLAQASRQSDPTLVARLLNDILRREFGDPEPYYAVFANSGAEGVEVAMKHAEFARVLRVQDLLTEIETHLAAVVEAVGSGAARVPEEVLRRLGAEPGDGPGVLADRVRAAVAQQAAQPPVFLTFAGSFHGKLAGSIQLTHNAGFRVPFAGLAASARFVAFEQPGAVAEAVEAEGVDVPDLLVEDGEIRLVQRPFPTVAAFVLEVIQGEGGIRMVSAPIAAELRAAADAAGFPVVVDEIQSGMGRTGAFFASSHIGLRADYFVLAKGLGGGIAKTAVTLIRESCYRPDFELLHSSTFARDGFSTALALRTLRVLEADGGAVYRLAARAGERLRTTLEKVRADFPDVVAEVRGRGLMLGVEFRDQSTSPLPPLREATANGILGYLFSGYLFRAHRIRTFPTASAVSTLRLEPSVYFGDEAVAELDGALRALCSLLRTGDPRLFETA